MMKTIKISTLFLILGLSFLGAGCVKRALPAQISLSGGAATSSESVDAVPESHCISQGATSECFSSPENLRSAIIEETVAMESNPVDDRYYGRPQPIQFSGHPKAWEFRTMLRQGEAQGPNAAGRYTIIPVWMTGSGARTWIIDAKTGEILMEDEVATCGWRYSIESAYLIEDPVEGGCSMVGVPSIWTVKKGKIENQGVHIFGKADPFPNS